MSPSLSLAEEFLSRARERGSLPAFANEHGVRTYAQVAREIELMAWAARGAGFHEGDVVAVIGATHAATLPAALAVRHAGGIPLLWPTRADVPRLVSGEIWSDPGCGVGTRRLEPEARPLPEGTQWIRATGGSTGERKLVAFTEAQILSAARARATLLGLRPGDVLVVTVPPSTGYGSMSSGLSPLLEGACIRPVSPLSPRAVLDAAREGAAWTMTTAPVIRALSRLPSISGSRPPVRFLVASSTYPREEAARAREIHGVLAFDRYGATETGPIAQSKEPGGPLHAAPGVEVRLVGESSLVEVSSAHVGLGYVSGLQFHGMHRTADRARALPDGGFVLLGRTDRVVRRAGRPVDLAALEKMLVRLPGVLRSRCTTDPGPLDLDLVAYVVPEAGVALDPSALLRALSAHLEPWERPSRLEVIASPAVPSPEKWCERGSEPDAPS